MTELAPGHTLLDRFRLDRLLGRGGMGQVWLATDSELGEEVALKILDDQLVGQPGMLDLLRHECRQARRLVHPNIVRVFDFHGDGTRAFISMEYVQGGELGQLRDAAPAEILRHLVPLADALAYAHGQGVVHRDIKPSNVLIDTSGNPRLVDFGVAGLLQGDGLALVGGGSPLSMSPEQRAGEPPSPADDAFALGVLTYELVAGFPPRVDSELAPPEPLSSRRHFEVPRRLVDLVAKLLAPEAALRPASMSAVRDELDAALQEAWNVTAAPERRVVAPTPAAEDTIVPVSHRPSESTTAAPRPAARQAAKEPRKSTAVVLWVSFSALIVLLLGVVFVLPKMVANNAETGTEAVRTGPSAEDELARLAEEKAAADEARTAFEAQAEALVASGVEEWAGSAFQDARALADTATLAYDGAEFVTATETWSAAGERLTALEARSAELLAAALERGTTALAAGRGQAAQDEFEAALALDSENEAALAGLARAERIDEVYALLAEAEGLEQAGEFEQARDRYQAAAELDPLVPAGAEGVERVNAAIVEQGYVGAMSRGYAALGAGNFETARRAFRQAARTRPGASEPREALARVDEEERVASIAAHQQAAADDEQGERWDEAVAEYEAALAIDQGLAFAQTGLQRARARAALDERLEAFLEDPERIYSPSVYGAAAAAVADARALPSPGPRLVGQIEQIEALMADATRPVLVRLESDQQTEVVLYRVGRLGAFDRFELELRPGTYTAVGTRNGFRDVRREFTVRPGTQAGPFVIRCEEPI
jgi:tetratricopeptide (TPR) repeat protein